MVGEVRVGSELSHGPGQATLHSAGGDAQGYGGLLLAQVGEVAQNDDFSVDLAEVGERSIDRISDVGLVGRT
jgi:hypothetical protein